MGGRGRILEPTFSLFLCLEHEGRLGWSLFVTKKDAFFIVGAVLSYIRLSRGDDLDEATTLAAPPPFSLWSACLSTAHSCPHYL